MAKAVFAWTDHMQFFRGLGGVLRKQTVES
jgi:hypothetical protein